MNSMDYHMLLRIDSEELSQAIKNDDFKSQAQKQSPF